MPRDTDGLPDVPRAIVIGAGFGGIAAALRARRLGYQARVAEALMCPDAAR